MKKSGFLFLTLLSLFYIGCIDENMDDCERCKLFFRYFGDGQTQVFNKHIEQVLLYVFNERDELVGKKIIDKKDLERYTGTTLNLSPGKYRIVCVGNALELTRIQGCDRGKALRYEDILMAHPGCFSGELVTGNDSLYFSERVINIPGTYWVKDTLTFVSSHLKVSLEIRGSGTLTSDPSQSSIAVSVKGLTPYTDFTNTPKGDPVEYNPGCMYRNGISKSCFNIMRHPFDNSISIVLTDRNTGKQLIMISLTDFLREHPAIDVTKQEVLIPIVVIFKEIGIVVTVPEWMEVEVKPEL